MRKIRVLYSLEMSCKFFFKKRTFFHPCFLVIIWKETKKAKQYMITQLSEKFSGTRKIKRKLSIIMDACLSTFNVPCFKWSFNCVCTFLVHISYVCVKMSHLCVCVCVLHVSYGYMFHMLCVCVCCQDDSSFDGNLSRCHIFWRGSNSVCVCVLHVSYVCVYVCALLLSRWLIFRQQPVKMSHLLTGFKRCACYMFHMFLCVCVCIIAVKMTHLSTATCQDLTGFKQCMCVRAMFVCHVCV